MNKTKHTQKKTIELIKWLLPIFILYMYIVMYYSNTLGIRREEMRTNIYLNNILYIIVLAACEGVGVEWWWYVVIFISIISGVDDG